MPTGGTSSAEQGAGLVEIVAGKNADLNSADGLQGGPVFKLPFETPDDYLFCLGTAEWGLRFFGVLQGAIEYGHDTGKIVRKGKTAARVKAAATALPGAYLIPEGGSTHHFVVSASPSPFRLVTDLSGQTVGTIYGPDNVTSGGSVPEIIIGEGAWSRISWSGPAATGTTAVHAAVTDNGAQQVVTTGITNPAPPRNITATAGGTAGDIKAIQVIITGKNIKGDTITETLPAFTVDTPGTVAGALAFAWVTSITIPAHDGTGATTAIGVGDILGLPDAAAARLVEAAIFNGAVEGTLPTLVKDADEIEKNTLDPNSALDGSQLDVLLYER